MEKYIFYLCLFVDLMCKLRKSNPEIVTEEHIESFVKKDYTPISQMMDICTKYQEDRAIAVLQERSGDTHSAILTNMNYIKKRPLIKMAAELIDIVKFNVFTLGSKEFLKIKKNSSSRSASVTNPLEYLEEVAREEKTTLDV